MDVCIEIIGCTKHLIFLMLYDNFLLYALSIIYKENLEFFNYEKNLLDILVASLDFTFSIQHKDGSFDEFYPNERGWWGQQLLQFFQS